MSEYFTHSLPYPSIPRPNATKPYRSYRGNSPDPAGASA